MGNPSLRLSEVLAITKCVGCFETTFSITFVTIIFLASMFCLL